MALKKNNLAHSHKVNQDPQKMFERGQGLDWGKIMGKGAPPEMQLTLDELDRVNRGLSNHYGDPDRKKKIAAQKNKPKGNTGRGLVFDVDEAVRLYSEEHLTPKEIADKLGIKTAVTIIKKLKDREVYDPKKYRPGGSHSRVSVPHRPADSYQRKTVCLRGHDLAQPGATREAPLKKGKGGKLVKNGHICVACKRADDQANYNWDEDPRNPKNGGNSGWDEVRKEKERQKRARDRLACTDEKCGHAGLKHADAGCTVRDCHCKLSFGALKAIWMELSDG